MLGSAIAKLKSNLVDVILVKEQPKTTVIVPNHKELDRGIRAIIK
jgi:hypothetical protein